VLHPTRGRPLKSKKIVQISIFNLLIAVGAFNAHGRVSTTVSAIINKRIQAAKHKDVKDVNGASLKDHL